MTAPTLTSKLDMESPEAKVRAERNRGLATDLREYVAKAALGGSERSRERHVSRSKFRDAGSTAEAIIVKGLGDDA